MVKKTESAQAEESVSYGILESEQYEDSGQNYKIPLDNWNVPLDKEVE